MDGSLPSVHCIVLNIEGGQVMAYLRTTIGTWNIDVFSAQTEQIFERIRREGMDVFQAQPGFVQYRLMRADAHHDHGSGVGT